MGDKKNQGSDRRPYWTKAGERVSAGQLKLLRLVIMAEGGAIYLRGSRRRAAKRLIELRLVRLKDGRQLPCPATADDRHDDFDFKVLTPFKLLGERDRSGNPRTPSERVELLGLTRGYTEGYGDE